MEPLLCRADPDAYFADAVRPAAARALCAGCGHLADCRTYALENPGLYGVWGGTTRRERQAVRRRGEVGERGPPRDQGGVRSRAGESRPPGVG
ncbi:WhiB family transcriptional regulator [Streptomyces sp. NPDC002685]|uniref:WhiB family transcriptional regulator n=1 Tax=Streptomyces sp. NPDC002685 TaxID=3154540 RepID=UPI00332FE7F8